MPPQLGQLTKLVVLTDFVIGKGKSGSIAELGPLEHLGGELCIRNLENVVDPSHATVANLKGKRYIEKLVLRWGKNDGQGRTLSELILEQLRPSSYLKALQIHNYPGVRFPNWLGEHCFSKLTSLHLNGGSQFTELPALGQLQLLTELKIECFDSIVRVGPEFYGNSSNERSFASLQKLTFSKMPRLQQLMPPPILDDNDGQGRAFPLLQELRMEHCPVLQTVVPILLDYPLPSLTLLERASKGFRDPKREGTYFRLWKLSTGLYGAECEGYESDLNILLEDIERIVCLQELFIARCQEIRSFQLGRLENLSSLYVSNCPFFESLYRGDEERPLTSLRSLSINWCSNFISFSGRGSQAPNLPNHMHSLLPSLTKLRLYFCTKLRSFPEGGLPSSIEKLEISFCNALESSPEGGFPSNLKELEIVSCLKLVADRKNWGLQALPCLTSLRIRFCEEVLESFPEETFLPPSLNSLQLSFFNRLKSLDYKALEHLPSLYELELYDCPLLHSLPEEGLPSSLQYLRLNNCPKALKERCQETGGDWHKISHIPRIEINYKKIKPRQSTQVRIA
ncbi:hypothetical protein Tsubulata_034242 [Turnera subulata]|uniref:R13L1/DRL21-like LRR repeat region domain-containing protein n=1 Tax=Turnera subulata TaxID=218843 RepID=A0A9Q0FA08_9ROSI|nr:hypothetical protein Tsubulata_034242 [Turnera subulata]